MQRPEVLHLKSPLNGHLCCKPTGQKVVENNLLTRKHATEVNHS